MEAVTPEIRHVLDLVGPWWMGVVSGYEGASLGDTRRRYAELRYRGTVEGTWAASRAGLQSRRNA